MNPLLISQAAVATEAITPEDLKTLKTDIIKELKAEINAGQQGAEVKTTEVAKPTDTKADTTIIDAPISKWDDAIKEAAAEHGMNILFAIIILVVGKIVVKMGTKIACKAMSKAKQDETLVKFADNLIFCFGMVFVFIAALTKLGIPSASMVAAVGAAGLAIGLSLQGALSNFAAGVLIIVFRPFKVGDLIEAGGTIGTVREIELFTTKLVTWENKTAVMPNAILTADKIINYTETENLRVDMTFGCSYGDDNEKVKELLMNILKEDSRVLAEPAPFVAISGHGDSSINYAVRPYVLTADYWGVYFDVHEKVKKVFDEQGISIPFPQRDIHIISEPAKEA
jgi:small conductance mechanosensitive channel